jgi:hypothetical protein
VNEKQLGLPARKILRSRGSDPGRESEVVKGWNVCGLSRQVLLPLMTSPSEQLEI